jgi:hypothetical protein
MAQPKTKRKTPRTVRFVKTPEPGRRAPKRKVRAAARPSVVRRRRVVTSSEKLPGWADLEVGKGHPSRDPEWSGTFAAIPILRLALVIMAIAAVFTLYVGHVHATSELLTSVNRLRSENLELYLERNLVKGSFDRASAPALISGRARALGLVEAVPKGAPITTPSH